MFSLPVLKKGQIKFLSPHNISGVSQPSIAASTLDTTEEEGTRFQK